MKKSISVNKKAIGRPRKKGGVHPVSAVRLPPEVSAGVDAWASKQADQPGRSESIRRLVELGLLSSTNSPDLRYQTKASESATKAKRLAGELGLKAKAK